MVRLSRIIKITCIIKRWGIYECKKTKIVRQTILTNLQNLIEFIVSEIACGECRRAYQIELALTVFAGSERAVQSDFGHCRVQPNIIGGKTMKRKFKLFAIALAFVMMFTISITSDMKVVSAAGTGAAAGSSAVVDDLDYLGDKYGMTDHVYQVLTVDRFDTILTNANNAYAGKSIL